MSDTPDHRFDVTPTAQTHFAWLRTRLSIERTLLSWIRTSIALIGFGFTIVQFFQRLQDLTPEARRTHPTAPRDLGLALIAAGLGCLAVATLQYRWGLRYLWNPDYLSVAGVHAQKHRTPALFAAVILMLIGLAAFVSVFVKFP